MIKGQQIVDQMGERVFELIAEAAIVEADADAVAFGAVQRHLVAQPAFPQQRVPACGGKGTWDLKFLGRAVLRGGAAIIIASRGSS